jgi:hypothetical protein
MVPLVLVVLLVPDVSVVAPVSVIVPPVSVDIVSVVP